MRFQPARTEQGRSLPDNRGEPPGNSWWGVCRPVFQIRPKNVIFITRFQTWTLKFIPFCTPGKGRNYAVIPKIRTSSLKKISWNPFLIRILIGFLLIHLELNRQIRTFKHSRSSLKNHTRFQTKMEKVYTCFQTSLRSRRLEVAGERENGRARGRHASPSRAPVFTCAHYFQAPATQAIFRPKRRKNHNLRLGRGAHTAIWVTWYNGVLRPNIQFSCGWFLVDMSTKICFKDFNSEKWINYFANGKWTLEYILKYNPFSHFFYCYGDVILTDSKNYIVSFFAWR